MITETHILGFKVFNALFFYMHPLPIKFKYESCKLSGSHSKQCWITAGVSVILVFLTLLAVIYVIIIDGIIRPRLDFGPLNYFIFLTCALVGIWFTVIVSIVLTKLQTLLLAYNKILSFEQKLLRTYSKLNHSKSRVIARVLVLVNIWAGMFPWCAEFVAILLNLDVGYFLLEKVLPNPFYRSTIWIVLAIPIRFAICFPFLFDGIRILSYFFNLAILCLESFIVIFNVLKHDAVTWPQFRLWYTQLLLIHKCIETIINLIAYISLNGIFWIVVICCSILVTAGLKLKFGMILTITCCFMTITLISGIVVILPKVCSLSTICSFIIKRKRYMVNLSLIQIVRQKRSKLATLAYIIDKVCQRKLDIKQGAAMMSLVFKCGPFFVLQRGFTIEFLNLMLIRVVDFTVVSAAW